MSRFRLSAAAILVSTAIAFSGGVAIAAPSGGTLTIYGTAAGELGPQYNAGTILVSDTVQLNDGATVGGSNNLVANGTLLFNQSAGNLLTISNTISGNGALTLQNSGTLRLSGTTPSLRTIPLNLTVNANDGFLTTPVVSGTQNGILQFGQSGTGTLNVAGGYVTSNNVHVGQAGGVGTVNVSSGTLVPTAFLVLGGTAGGHGTLNVTGGIVGGPVGQGLGNGIQIARTATSSGLMTIASGSVLVNGNSTVIGELGSGTVSVNSGGFFQAGRVDVGVANTGVGTLNINTSGKADFLSYLTIGGTGQGTFTVNGGLIQTRGGTIGGSAGSLGTATITSGTWLNNATGSGSEIAGYLTVGGSGTGSLTINDGGYVVVTGTFSKGANGTLTLNQGGTLQIGGVNGNNNGGVARYMVASTGTIGSGTAGVLVGDLDFAGTLKFAQNSAGTSPTLAYNGALSGAGDLVKTGTGTLLLGGNNSYTGGTTLVAGVISLNSANAIGTSGTISFSGGTLQATSNNTTDYSSRFSDAPNQQYAIDSNGEDLTLASDLTSVGGSFLKSGTGSVTLTGANTFTSGSVRGGLLQGSATSLATSGTFGVATLQHLKFTSGTANESWAGQMFGSGTFSKTGAGTLTLSGSGGSTTGTLLISEGAIRGTTGNLTRNIVNNSQLTFDQSTSGTYARGISGSGNMLLSNSGTITFSGTNTLTGTATVSGGALVATRAGAMPQNVVNNANVEFANSVNGTYAGSISGNGGLTKSGTGSLTFTGTNTYSGLTNVTQGLLTGNTNNLPGAIAVVSGGTVAFNQTTSGTASGPLSGVGSFVKQGAGDLTLTGTNTNGGPWTVSAGRLIGTTSSIRGNVTNNAAVTFDQTISGTYSQAMSGTGTFTKLGGGTAVLGGSNSYSGATTVSGGALVINGSLTNSAVTVENLATLGGSGTIGSSVTVQSGGTISPGNSPGLLTVGSLALQAGSTTLMEIIGVGSAAGTAGTDYDKLAITTAGGLGYGGTLDLGFGNTATFADGTIFSLFSFSGSPTGTFSSVTSSGTGSYGGLTFGGVSGVWTALFGGQQIIFSELTGELRFENGSSPVPEIDPSSFGSALTLLIGSLGLLERRARRRTRA